MAGKSFFPWSSFQWIYSSFQKQLRRIADFQFKYWIKLINGIESWKMAQLNNEIIWFHLPNTKSWKLTILMKLCWLNILSSRVRAIMNAGKLCESHWDQLMCCLSSSVKTWKRFLRKKQSSEATWKAFKRKKLVEQGYCATYLELELATLLFDLLRRLFNESPRLTMPLPVIEKCLSL